MLIVSGFGLESLYRLDKGAQAHMQAKIPADIRPPGFLLACACLPKLLIGCKDPDSRISW